MREAIFDVLGSMGGVEGCRVLDLFCGSGALGLEALSRGAASAVFVDHDAAALRAVETNAQAIGLGAADITLVRAELPGWLASAGRKGAGIQAFEGDDASASIALCDPPYAFDRWQLLLSHLEVDVAVLESGTQVELPPDWVVTRARRYGGTLVTVARMSGVRSGAGREERP